MSTDELTLSVEDTGPGVPPQDRQRIFEPFAREQSFETSHVPGCGLGLVICRSIVLAHGGRIQVGERPGGGARFSVHLPAERDLSFTLRDQRSESTTHPYRRRRGADAQAPREQPESLRLPNYPVLVRFIAGFSAFANGNAQGYSAQYVKECCGASLQP